MKKILRAIEFQTANYPKLLFNLGALYKIKKPYKAKHVDTDYLNSMDIVTSMVVGVTSEYITCMCLYLDTGTDPNYNNLKITDVTEDGLIIKGGYNDINLTNDRIWSIVSAMANSYEFRAHIQGYDIDLPLSVFSLALTKSDLKEMTIIPTNITIRDMRIWPRKALMLWINSQLGLSEDQTRIVADFRERWKLIETAQEMFTHRCAEFNKVAKKKVDELKNQQKPKQEEIKIANPYYHGRDVFNINGMLFMGTKANDSVNNIDFMRDYGKYLLYIRGVDKFFDPDPTVAPNISASFYDESFDIHRIFILSRSIVGGHEGPTECYIKCEIANVEYYTVLSTSSTLCVDDLCIISMRDEELFLHIKNEMRPAHVPHVVKDDYRNIVDPYARRGYITFGNVDDMPIRTSTDAINNALTVHILDADVTIKAIREDHPTLQYEERINLFKERRQMSAYQMYGHNKDIQMNNDMKQMIQKVESPEQGEKPVNPFDYDDYEDDYAEAYDIEIGNDDSPE